MATIVTRAGKGSALTWTEADANITNLNTDISNITNGTTAVGAINISTTDGNTSDTTMFPVLVGNNATGGQTPHIDGAGLTYNASTNTLTASAFGGALNGTVGATTPNTGVFTGLTAKGTTSTAKLTVDSTALSSTAWTTAGIGLKVQAATYTDTSSVAGTVAASHVHAIAAPTMASTNAITVTDAGTLYISGAPTASTNTTITNAWALLANGRIKATAIDNTPVGSTTASTGAFTTLSASSTVSGTGFSTYLASPPAIGGTTAAAVTGTTVTATSQFSGPGTGLTGTATSLSIGGNAATATTATSAASATKATNLVGGNATTLLGSLPYQSNTDTTSLLSPNTTTTLKYLTQVGDGTNGMAPMWSTIASLNNVIIGSTGAAAGTFTTLTASTTGTTGTLNITYNPATASGQAINVTGKDSQGGVGYLDFLKTTNTTSGATNANKTFRTNSTGQLEVVNSAYTTVILALTDAGNLQVPSATVSNGALTVNAANELRLADSDSSNYVGFKSPATVTANKVWTLPSADGTSGQVLSTDGAGTLSWATAGGSSGNNIIILSSSGGSQFVFPSTASAVSTSYFNLESSGGISGVSVNTTNKTFTLPAGTYVLEIPPCWAQTTYFDFNLNNNTDGTDTTISYIYGFTPNNAAAGAFYGQTVKFTIAASKTFRFTNSSGSNATWNIRQANNTLMFKIYKTA